MLQIILHKFKKLWETWDLRLLILISLSLQAFLVLFATFRKRSAAKWVIMSVWSAYLLADWVAAVTVGLISSSQCHNSDPGYNNGDLYAIWAPFLLLHLGGPDTITSFSLEDNQLWLRHLLGVILQVGAAIYIFLQSLPKNKIWIATALVLVAGTIKYAERTRALFLASLDRFGDSVCRKPNPGPDYERVQQMYNAMRFNHLPARAQVVRGPDERLRGMKYKDVKDLNDLDDKKSLLRYAFGFFETFKGLIPGLLLSSQDRQLSRDFFLNRTQNDTYKLIEIELSLMYEVLHTKVAVVRCWAGFIFRSISSISVVVALLTFVFVDKRGFRKFDVHLTYVLFIGALILDALSVIKLMFLDRTVAALENWWAEFIAHTIIKNRRWSETFYCCDFLTYCFEDFPRWITHLANLFWAGILLDRLKIMRSLSSEHFNEDLKKFIFEELREKSLAADNASEISKICSSRGDWVLGHLSVDSELKRSVQDEFNWSVQEVEYPESLLLWHIATELRFNVDDSEELSVQPAIFVHKKLSKLLSDYALYLLLMQPTIMAAVSGNWKMVFQDTCAEAKRFFRNNSCSEPSGACVEILKINSDIKPGAVKGDVSKSVLFDACRLAKQLSKLEEQNQWKLMSKVWLELLCYAAVHCRANVHAQQPSKGGELITLIWLLMNHFGLGIQFYEANAARIKFIVKK